MRILYIHQYFKTPLEPGGTRSYWISKKLVEVGHQVTMITSKSGMKSKTETVMIDGIQVIYVNVPYDNNMSIPARLYAFMRFMWLSTAVGFQKEFDLVIATSTPLTVGFPALVLKKLRQKPYIFEVRDLWPEVPIQMGGLKNRMLIELAKVFERSIYKNAIHIIALSPGMYEGVKSVGVSDEKISMIPNMSKIDEFWPREKNLVLQRELGLSESSFKIIHFGTLGIANGAMSIIETAIHMKKEVDVEFIFLGGGSTEKELEDRCRRENLKNVHFLGKFGMTTTSEIVNVCDVSIVSFLNLPILYTNSPNKLFDSLSAGKPIIVNSAGWTKELVEEYKCGLYVDPDNPDSLKNAILFLKNNKEAAKQMGKASRKLAEDQYDKSILVQKFAEIILAQQTRVDV